MSISQNFNQYMEELRKGDESAITRFLAEFEPFIRRTLRYRLQRAALRQVADSMDVCQSVMGSFLIRLSAGEYEIHSESDLRKLVAGIANKKFLMLCRREAASKRDHRLTTSLENVNELANRETDSRITALEQIELIQKVRQSLSIEERFMFDARRNGTPWDEIATQLGENSIALRQRLSRALKRLSTELLGDED